MFRYMCILVYISILSLLILVDSSQAKTTDSGFGKDRFWSTGIFGAFGPGTNMTFFPGASVGWSTNVRQYNIGADLLFTWPKDDAMQWPPNDIEVFQYGFLFWSLTARRFLSQGDVAPVIGAGVDLAVIYGRITHKGWSITDGTKRGFGAHITFGAEVLRHTNSRLRLEARADLPFFKFSASRGSTFEPPYKSYLLPITIGISYHR